MPNRLADEDSPYLIRHSNNPIDWFPWSQEAFSKAERENKVIFLSIGYNACHWCHVMERESFEDEEIASILNEKFVSIKVDKEERPDIDRHFQDIFLTMNGRAGGWPLSIFMTPQKIPIYSALYIPKEPGYGSIAFVELLKSIAKKYEKDSQAILKKGREVLSFMAPPRSIQATKIDRAIIDILSRQLKSLYDEKNGGFGSAPKFPRSSAIHCAITLSGLGAGEEFEEIVSHTLESMTRGGFYDIVDGGFCRYSTDERWLVPHFEKMCYDNALMAEVLIDSYHLLSKELYRDLAFETLDFMLERMSVDGLFYSSIDADSEGAKGSYYLYDYDEVLKLFEENDIPNPRETAHRLAITPEGNFEGKSIARLESNEIRNDEDIRKAIGLLRAIRSRREFPDIDEKIITSWNSMMLKALFKAARLDSRYLDIAMKSLEALRKKMKRQKSLYHSALAKREARVEGFLEDYAWYCSALIEAYRSTLDENMLIECNDMLNEAIRRFYADGKWRISDGEFGDFEDDRDSTYPSSVAVMVDTLQYIHSLVDPVYRKFIFRTLEVHSYELMRQPIARAMLAEKSIRYLEDELVLKGPAKSLRENLSIQDVAGYPPIVLKAVEGERYSLCGKSSCLVESDSIARIYDWIEKEKAQKL